jgi:hypothetical protein
VGEELRFELRHVSWLALVLTVRLVARHRQRAPNHGQGIDYYGRVYCSTSLWLKEPYVPDGAAKTDAFNEYASQHRIVDRSCAGYSQNPL